MLPDFDRRQFLSACSVLASSLVACSGVTTRTRVASSFIANPSLDDYRPALRALIATILPFGSPGFAVDPDFVEQRFLRMFPLEDERKFLPLQQTLVYFDQLDLAPHIAAPLIVAERIALDVPERMPSSEFRRLCAEKTERETRACDLLLSRFHPSSRFTSLGSNERAAWFQLWATSEFSAKREFAGRLRSCVVITAYSADRLWPALGYEGPLVGGTERSS